MLVTNVRPLYADTDQMGVVNHAVALRWFELARAEWLRRLDYTYREFEETGHMLPVYEVGIRYHRPARYDQLLALEAELQISSPVRVIFNYRVRDQQSGALLLEGTTKHAVTSKGGRPKALSDELRAIMQRGLAEQQAQTQAANAG
ncbi:thioesterase family protein [Haliangium sp. UPWRP_2]|uniref:acyl-CoA thioesterase n=1 Tax=Haliangium sp. UPWRP_2 TaxID=1931276 RepID=UPI000B53E171|nr:thioesterase family protein [Haliangium sp. UPWRP_2]PSM32415.1 acyl-CoA thioesterase [Haliangium sp. UPWRP_2]HNN91521.1 thioesterase family protein [Pseudomonadota bacterium]